MTSAEPGRGEMRRMAEEAIEIRRGVRCGFCGLPCASDEDWKRCDPEARTPRERGEGLCWDEGRGNCSADELPHLQVLARAVLDLLDENERTRKAFELFLSECSYVVGEGKNYVEVHPRKSAFEDARAALARVEAEKEGKRE